MSQNFQVVNKSKALGSILPPYNRGMALKVSPPKRPAKVAKAAPPPPSRKPVKAATAPKPADKTSLSAESKAKSSAPSSRVSAITAGLESLDKVSAADHKEWGGQVTDPQGKPIKPGKTETDEGRVEKVGEYWKDVGMSGWDGKTDQPWSSAYISSLHKRAGITNFNGSIRHGSYIDQAIKDRKGGNDKAPYWGYKPSERAPEKGDLVCWTRKGSTASFDDQRGGKYTSHCDRVQSVNEGTITTLGGNVGDSVSTRQFKIDGKGKLDDPAKRFIAVLAPKHFETK